MLKVFDFEKTPIVDIVNEILVDASSRGASDIHFDPKDNLLQIRIRIDGELVDYATVPEEYIKNLITRIKIISGMNITESRLPQDGAIKGIVKDIELDLRVSSINTNKGEKIVIRILDYTLSLNGIEKLGFTDYNYKKVLEMIGKPNGIILVTGATGTGKTTTVYSMLQRLSNDTTNIMSIEDPVEMVLDNVNQIQVNADIGLTFATALRSILRQDPNIIMIGEIRDSETATIAIRASVTGHLVLSTLHTNDSLSTIERLMDMNVEKYLLAEALEGIVSQRLARRLCPHCKKLRKTTTYEKELIKKTLDLDVDEIYEAVGCEHCNHGYKGRIAFQEVLTIDQKIQDALSMNIRKDKLRNLVYNDSVITLLQDGMIKVLRGDTTIEELLRLVEFDDDSIVTFNLPKDILDNELNKAIEYQDDVNEKSNNDTQDNDTDEGVIEDEIIVPETSDVVIDSIDDNDIEDDNIDVDNTDIDNMDVLDNDEEFIDKIDEVITEKEEKKKSRLFGKKKDKKKKDKELKEETQDIIDESDINDITPDNTTDNSEVTEDDESELDNMESLDNDEEFTDKINDVITEENNNEIVKSDEEKTDAINTNDSEITSKIIQDDLEIKEVYKDNGNNSKKKKKDRKKKDKKQEIQTESEIPITDENSENNSEVITPTVETLKKNDNEVEKDVIEVDETNSKSKKNARKKKIKTKDTDNIKESEDLKMPEENNETINGNNTVVDENIITDDTNIEDAEVSLNNEPIKEEITNNDIIELEEAIESIKDNNDKVVEENEDNSNNEVLENTIKISINDKDDSNDISVSEVKTVNMAPVDSDAMEPLDYNASFIDKIYDSVNTDEKRIIEKNNIDYEKIERLEDIQDEIGSRVSRMLNKKRYRKKKSE